MDPNRFKCSFGNTIVLLLGRCLNRTLAIFTAEHTVNSSTFSFEVSENVQCGATIALLECETDGIG